MFSQILGNIYIYIFFDNKMHNLRVSHDLLTIVLLCKFSLVFLLRSKGKLGRLFFSMYTLRRALRAVKFSLVSLIKLVSLNKTWPVLMQH